MQIPRATYRLQFNEQFRLTDALALVPYLHSLGVSHVYASPLFQASPHSQHGYDVCDFGRLNPEIGTESDLAALAAALHERGMGIVLDIVPNHMGITSPDNWWWWDVLTHGRNSAFAGNFDIDWNPDDESLRGKILVPILGADYGEILNRHELRLLLENGKFLLGYFEHRLPIAPESITGLPADEPALAAFNSDLPALDNLIRRQHYQLAFYREGDSRLNYRRFFAVTTLAAVRQEIERVFESTHSLLRRWLDQRLIDGVRVDHPDGLRAPGKYLQRLRKIAPDAWLVVEKILEPDEPLPASWPVQGTTGYDFLNQVNGLFIDKQAEGPLTGFYASFTGEPIAYPSLLAEKKRLVLTTLMVAELNRLTRLLAATATHDAVAKKYPRDVFRDALAEVVAWFPVYRPYLAGNVPPDASDMAVIKLGVHLACERRPDLPPEVFAFIHGILTTVQRTEPALEFVARFQQLTGACMAKGAEDTAFYCFNRFVSQNEVGGYPGAFGVAPADFHRFLQAQAAAWPHSQLTTSTHDTKRSEDVRARLNVLSEIPADWIATVRRWAEMTARYREDLKGVGSNFLHSLPDSNAIYLFFQTLVGAWPLPEDRLLAYMEKAVHEAKQHTDWTHINEKYESALKKFMLNCVRDREFVADLENFLARLADAAAVNTLAQTLIKLTAPGVPDIYQGCELWDYSLVDPDNRRPVDFALRQKLLAAAQPLSAAEAWQQRASGLPKLWLIQKVLRLRAAAPDAFQAAYAPIYAQGDQAELIVAFSRGDGILTVVPRFSLKRTGPWQNTSVELPPGSWYNELTQEATSGKILAENLFRQFPVALLIRKEIR